MPYCTQADVQEEFKSLPISATSVMKDDQVDRFIEEADAEIDARLGVRFQTPIVASGSLPLLRKISILLVASRIKEILEVKADPEQLKQGEGKNSLAREARALLQDIVDQRMSLPGALPVTTHQGVKSFNADCSVPHTFKKGVDQW